MALVHGWGGFADYAVRMKHCGEELVYARDSETNERILIGANFCKIRLCPTCAYNRSRKVFGQVSKVMDSLDDGYRYIFLTLTVKNVAGDELSPALDKLFKGYRDLTQRTIWKPFKGWFRALEITYNRRERTYHPHFHVIIAVRPSYFKCAEYVSQAAMRLVWRDVMKLDYDPQVDMRRVKLTEDGGLTGAVKEVAKYTLKTSDFLRPEDLQAAIEPVKVLTDALFHRRLVAFGGVMRAAHKALNLDDPIDGDLTERAKLRPDVRYVIERFHWGVGGICDWVLTGVETPLKVGGSGNELPREYKRECRKALAEKRGEIRWNHLDQKAEKLTEAGQRGRGPASTGAPS